VGPRWQCLQPRWPDILMPAKSAVTYRDSIDPDRMDDLTSFSVCSQSRPIMRPTVPPTIPTIRSPNPYIAAAARSATSRAFRQRAADSHDRWLGDRGLVRPDGRRRTAAAAHDADARRHAHHHRAATPRPTSASTARSIPIVAASMAASTASPGRPTPISACRPGLDFETKILFKPDAAKLLTANSPRRSTGPT